MKSVVITEVKFPVRCDFYLCEHMAKHEFATPSSPPGQCFRVCDEHLEGLRHVLEVQEKVVEKVVEKIVEVPVPQAQPTTPEAIPQVQDVTPTAILPSPEEVRITPEVKPEKKKKNIFTEG